MKPENYRAQLDQKILKNAAFASDRERIRQRMGEVVRNHPESARLLLHMPYLATVPPPTVPTGGGGPPVGGAHGGAGGGSRQFASFRKTELPSFSGKLREFPVFETDWLNLVAPTMSDAQQLKELRSQVPKKDRPIMERFTALKDFWDYMKSEYADPWEFLRDRLAELELYAHPKHSASDYDKFDMMYVTYSEVYNYLKAVYKKGC